MADRRLIRASVTALLTAAITSGVAIVINIATELKVNPWAWISVGLLTLLSALVAATGDGAPNDPSQSQIGGDRSRLYQAGRDISIRSDDEGV